MLQLNFGASSIHKCKNVSFFLTLETCIIYLVPEVFTFMVDQNRSFCSIDFSQNLNSEHFECLELFLMNLVDLFIEEMLMISRSVFFLFLIGIKTMKTLILLIICPAARKIAP